MSESLPEPKGIISKDITEATRRISERLRVRLKNKDLKRARKAFESDYLPCMKQYGGQMDLFEECSSFSKTNADAAFIHMKQSTLSRLQCASEHFYHRARDTTCMVEHFCQANRMLHDIMIADAGYESEENYASSEKHDVRVLVKHIPLHKKQKRSFKTDPTRQKNWIFNKKSDTWTCSEGHTLIFLKEQDREKRPRLRLHRKTLPLRRLLGASSSGEMHQK